MDSKAEIVMVLVDLLHDRTATVEDHQVEATLLAWFPQADQMLRGAIFDLQDAIDDHRATGRYERLTGVAVTRTDAT